jgi:hypothetical protein
VDYCFVTSGGAYSVHRGMAVLIMELLRESVGEMRDRFRRKMLRKASMTTDTTVPSDHAVIERNNRPPSPTNLPVSTVVHIGTQVSAGDFSEAAACAATRPFPAPGAQTERGSCLSLVDYSMSSCATLAWACSPGCQAVQLHAPKHASLW